MTPLLDISEMVEKIKELIYINYKISKLYVANTKYGCAMRVTKT